MLNVYQQIRLFYDKRPTASSIYKINKMERFFRERAWAGESESSQIRYWGVISSLFAYLCEQDIPSFLEMSSYDIQEVLFIYAENHPDFQTDESGMNDFLNIIEDFSYYFDQDCNGDYNLTFNDIVEEAREAFYVNSKYTLPDREYVKSQTAAVNKLLDLEENDLLNDLMNVTLTKMSIYFQGIAYHKDLEKAVFHFVGPLMDADFNETFVATFWDYFFFDYHLTKDGLTPIKHYYQQFKDKMSESEKQLIMTMVNASFRLFVVKSIIDDNVYCQDLLTDEEFDLPYPETNMGDYTKLLFFGHLQINDILMLNYITATPASPLLCKRIKTEIINLFNIYKKYQFPDATLDDFLKHHSAAVRHTVILLTTFSAVKLLNEDIDLPVPEFDMPDKISSDTMSEINYAAEKLYLDESAKNLFIRLINNYLNADNTFNQEINYPKLVAGAAKVFNTINGIISNTIIIGIYHHLKLKKIDVEQFISQITEKLGIIPADPRYITTEGFIHLLYKDKTRSD